MGTMTDRMLEGEELIRAILAAANADADTTQEVVDEYRAVCWEWARANATALAIEDCWRKQNPDFIKTVTPAEFGALVSRHTFNTFPPEWQEPEEETE